MYTFQNRLHAVRNCTAHKLASLCFLLATFAQRNLIFHLLELYYSNSSRFRTIRWKHVNARTSTVSPGLTHACRVIVIKPTLLFRMKLIYSTTRYAELAKTGEKMRYAFGVHAGYLRTRFSGLCLPADRRWESEFEPPRSSASVQSRIFQVGYLWKKITKKITRVPIQ